MTNRCKACGAQITEKEAYICKQLVCQQCYFNFKEQARIKRREIKIRNYKHHVALGGGFLPPKRDNPPLIRGA